jgi:hypothetical protein
LAITVVSDGYIYNNTGVSADWRAATFGDVNNTNPTNYVGTILGGASAGNYRSYLFFDLADIPIGAIITSAELGLYVLAELPALTTNITIQDGSPTYPHNPLETTDYNLAYYSGNGGSRNASTISGVGYWNITFSTLGIEWLSNSVNLADFKVCLRSSYDVDNTLSGTSSEYVHYYGIEQGAEYAATLYVTYTVGDLSYTIIGPYYDDTGGVASDTVNVIVYSNSSAPVTFALSGANGSAQTRTVYLTEVATYLVWNASSSSSNYTRTYDFMGESSGTVYIYISNPAVPSYPYTFVITDFFGMQNPYLESTITLGNTTYILERKNINTIGTVSFVMTQWSTYGLRFVCDQGTYTLTFIAETSFTTSLPVLTGAFPTSNYTTPYAYALRETDSDIYVYYDNPDNNTVWAYFNITHRVGSIDILDYTANQTASTYSFTWTEAYISTEYDVCIVAQHNSTSVTWRFNCAAAVTNTNPIGDLMDSLGTWPAGLAANTLPAAALILFGVGIFSYRSAGLSCGVGFILGCVFLYLGWWNIGVSTLGFSGFVTAIVWITESKKEEP